MGTPEMDPRRRKFAENIARGLGRKESHIMAGFTGDKDNAAKLEQTPEVAEKIAQLRAETAKNAGITKEDVAAGLKAAATMAQMMSDPQGMVAAWRELGKLLGFYAPEVKRIESKISKKDLKHALEDMRDDELRALASGKVVEGVVIGRETAPQLPDLQKK